MLISVFTDELYMDASKALPIIAGWGCRTVDFRGNINGKGIEYQTDDELRALRKQMDDLGLKAGVLQSSLLKVHLPGEERIAVEMEKLEGLIRASDILGTKLVRAFFGWQPEEVDVSKIGSLVVMPDMFQRVLNAFRPFAEQASQAGLIFGFENCGVTPPEIFALLDALNLPGWGLAWDVSNHWELVPSINEPKAQKEYILACLKRSNMIHVKATSILPELEGVKIDWPRILRGVAALQVEGMPVSVETHNPRKSPFTNEEATRLTYAAITAAVPLQAPTGLEEAVGERIAFMRSYADNPVRFVVVGLGMGRFRAAQLKGTPGCELVGVSDIVADRAKEAGEFFNVPWATDIQVFLDDPNVEVMYVVTPTGNHCETAIRCMRAGKHVLTTKPMDSEAGACRAAIAEAKKQGVLFGVDFDLRHENPLLSLVEANRRGYFGRVLSATVSLKVMRNQKYYDANGAWRGTFRLDGGGAMSNQGIHEVDRLICVLGMPKRVTGYTATQAHVIEAEDLGCGIWEYESGAVATFYSTTCYPAETWYARVEIHGTAGAYIYETGGANPAAERWLVDGKWSPAAPHFVAPTYSQGSDNFASAVRLGVPLTGPGEEGLKSRVVLDAMYKSAKSGGAWVDVEL